MPIDSQNGTAVDIHSCRSSSFVLPFSPKSICSRWRLRSSGSPNHSSVMRNIQSTAAWSFGARRRVGGERLHPALAVPEVERLLAVDLDERALPRAVRSCARRCR